MPLVKISVRLKANKILIWFIKNCLTSKTHLKNLKKMNIKIYNKIKIKSETNLNR